MGLTYDRGVETELTITPIVAWRRWVVSQRRHWEGGTGVVLRGAWGRAWTDTTLAAQCLGPPVRPDMSMGRFLDSMESGRHATPPPDPDCTCGIYAEKIDTVVPTQNPRLVRRPTVGGFVELTGRVIEGSRGYRAGEAKIIGPLELHVPCAGETTTSGSCPNSATVILHRDRDPVGACEEHVKIGSGVEPIAVDDWVDQVIPRLEATYTTEIIHFKKGATHGHR